MRVLVCGGRHFNDGCLDSDTLMPYRRTATAYRWRTVKMRPKLRVLSLFAGIGGFDLGLERTGGFETVAFCEIEPYQRALLKQHWPLARQIADIHDLAHVACDVITGGFPCQKFSTASRGRRVAADLWPEMHRVVAACEPSYVIAENVSEYAINIAAEQLAGLGYTVAIRNISGDECGAPHVRSRWWAVAHPHEEGEFPALCRKRTKPPNSMEGVVT